MKFALGLVLGLAIGACCCSLVLRHLNTNRERDEECSGVVELVDTLVRTRNLDHKGLIADKESLLADGIWSLSVAVPAGWQLTRWQTNALLAAQSYYQRFPATGGDTNINLQVASFLSGLRTPSAGESAAP
jgi:hypothetical protein